MITPAVGRIVWYFRGEDDPGPSPEGQPLAAIVTHVHSDRLINLSVFDATGVPYSRCSVTLVQPGESPPTTGRFANWMPYQIGQAKSAA